MNKSTQTLTYSTIEHHHMQILVNLPMDLECKPDFIDHALDVR